MNQCTVRNKTHPTIQNKKNTTPKALPTKMSLPVSEHEMEYFSSIVMLAPQHQQWNKIRSNCPLEILAKSAEKKVVDRAVGQSQMPTQQQKIKEHN